MNVWDRGAFNLEVYSRSFDAEVQRTVAVARHRSPGFRRRVEAVGLGAVASVDDLAGLPVLRKEDLVVLQAADPPFGGFLAPDTEVLQVFQSPGPLYEPLIVAGDAWRFGPALRAAGFESGDVAFIAYSFHLSPGGTMFEVACRDLGVTTVAGGVGSKTAQVRACRDLGVTGYLGVPSYLHALLETADEEGLEVRFKKALVGGEPLPRTLRESLQGRVATVRQAYGTAETGLVGLECEAQEGLHVAPDALVQVCDPGSGAPLEVGEQGEIVVTLFSTDYPVVRFGTGDLTRWRSDRCPCGLDTPRIEGWLGRVGEAVKVRGMFLHPRQLETVARAVPQVSDYRITVDRANEQDVLHCEIVPVGPDSDAVRAFSDALLATLRFRVAPVVVAQIPEDQPRFEDRRSW